MSKDGFENDAVTKIAIESAIQDALREEGVITTVSVTGIDPGSVMIITLQFSPYIVLPIDPEVDWGEFSSPLLSDVCSRVGFFTGHPLDVRYHHYGEGNCALASAQMIAEQRDVEELKNRAAQKRTDRKILARIKRLINRL